MVTFSCLRGRCRDQPEHPLRGGELLLALDVRVVLGQVVGEVPGQRPDVGGEALPRLADRLYARGGIPQAVRVRHIREESAESAHAAVGQQR